MKSIISLIFNLCFSVQLLAQSGLPIGNPQEAGLSNSGLNRVQNYLNKQFQDKKIPGSVAIIVRHGKIVFQQASGKANLETGEDMRMDHLFRMASMTKIITTVAALKLYERGLFQMDTPLANILPEFANPKVFVSYDAKSKEIRTKPAQGKILMKHVFTHTSGIVYPLYVSEGKEWYMKAGVAMAFPKPGVEINLGDEIKKLAALPLSHEPGESWTYGMNMDVLGRVIEVLDGRSFPQFVREEIFEPLKMKRSYFGVPKEEWKNMTQAYSPGLGGIRIYNDDVMASLGMGSKLNSVDYWKNTNTKMAFGGADMISCAQDYARFLQMILNYGSLENAVILSKKTIEMLEKPLFSVSTKDIVALGNVGNKVHAGLSVAVFSKEQSMFELISSGTYFWAGYFNTHFWVDRKEDIFAIVLTQFTPDPFKHNLGFRHLVWGSISK